MMEFFAQLLRRFSIRIDVSLVDREDRAIELQTHPRIGHRKDDDWTSSETSLDDLEREIERGAHL